MKITFEGTPAEYAAFIQVRSAPEGDGWTGLEEHDEKSVEQDVLDAFAPMRATNAPQVILPAHDDPAGVQPKRVDSARVVSAYEAVDTFFDQYLMADPEARQGLVRALFVTPGVVDLFVAGGGIRSVAFELGHTRLPRAALWAVAGSWEPTIDNAIALIYTLANMDGLMTPELHIAALPRMSPTQFGQART